MSYFLDRFLFNLVRLFFGGDVAFLFRDIADRVYPQGSGVHPVYKRFRFVLRSIFYFSESVSWYSYILSHPSAVYAFDCTPSIAEKLHRPYLNKNLSARDRLDILKSHYEIFGGFSRCDVLVSALSAMREISSIAGKTGQAISLFIGPPRSLQKEGELLLELRVSAVTVYKVAFSFIKMDTGAGVFIGAIQGLSNAEKGKELIRNATVEMHGARPVDVILLSVRVISKALGLSGIVACGDINHIYRHFRKNRGFNKSYDSVWNDNNGVQMPDGNYLIPIVRDEKSLLDYPSKKRAAISRRNDFLASWSSCIEKGLGG